jgi:hypothetical protein
MYWWLNNRILTLNIMSVLIFAVLYYLQDVLITNNKEFAEKYGLLDSKFAHRFYSNEESSLFYYLWYSLITQTTVGYAGVVNTRTGVPISFMETPNRVFKVLNILQLISILVIMAVWN